MAKVYEGKLDATGKKFGILVGRFNDFIGKRLLEGALDCLVRHGAKEEQITVVWVPGTFEMPAVAKRLVAGKKYDALVCLGAVLRGDTPHFDFIAGEAAKGIAKVGMEAGIPVIFGIITADTLEQAIERAGTKSGNKGWTAALSAIEMANLYRVL
jgi:6,7-dimethyl-8-ribityllumazine synthase